MAEQKRRSVPNLAPEPKRPWLQRRRRREAVPPREENDDQAGQQKDARAPRQRAGPVRVEHRQVRTLVDPPLTIRASASTIEPLVDLAEAGFGIACLPDFAVARAVGTGTLMIVLDRYVGMRGVFKALWPSSRHVAPKVRVFVDHMADALFRR